MPAIRLAATLPASAISAELWTRLCALRDRPGRVRGETLRHDGLEIETIAVDAALLGGLTAIARVEGARLTVWRLRSAELPAAFLPAIAGLAREHGAAIGSAQGGTLQLNGVGVGR